MSHATDVGDLVHLFTFQPPLPTGWFFHLVVEKCQDGSHDRNGGNFIILDSLAGGLRKVWVGNDRSGRLILRHF